MTVIPAELMSHNPAKWSRTKIEVVAQVGDEDARKQNYMGSTRSRLGR